MTEQRVPESVVTSSGVDDRRKAAIARLTAKRDLSAHVVTYVVVNTAFVAIWASTGGGYFWPMWIIACWGIGLVLHFWETYGRRPITEEDIQREMTR
jgi:hypothetical protein